MKRLLALVLLFATVAPMTRAQETADSEKRILQAVEERNPALAIEELRSIAARDQKLFETKNYDYLLARLLERNGSLAEAMARYDEVADRHSPLADFANAHLAQIARETGNLLLERIYLYRLSKGRFALAAAERRARNDFQAGWYAEVIRILSSGGAPQAGGTQTRELQELLAESYLHGGQPDQARPLLTGLLDSVPNPAQADDVAQRSAKALDLIDEQANLSEAEHLRRGIIFQFNRDFPAAKLHFEAIIAQHPGSPSTADAIFQIGRCFAQQSDFVEAVKWYERILEQFPDAAVAKDALLQAAAAYSRIGKPKEAEKRYQNYIDKYPNDERLDRAYLNIVDILRDHGADQDALKWCAKTEETFRGKLPEAVAIFAEARIYIAREEWPSALQQLDRLKGFADLGGSSIPGGTSAPEVTFLRGFILEQLTRYPEAVDTYLSIPDGRGEYYGWRASERLKILASNEASQAAVSQKLGALTNQLKAKDAEERRVASLAVMRLTDNPEIREKALAILKAVLKYPFPPEPKPFPPHMDPDAEALTKLGLYDDAIIGMSADPATYARAERADRAIAIVEPAWRQVPADYPIALIPRERLRLLYPAVYHDALLSYSTPRRIDPRLLLAIMRQESRFQPDAKSNAAARGLMQFISTTSTRVASELGRTRFAQDDLYQPDTAVLFGSQFVGDLFVLFPQQPEAVVAAYNGGDDNVKRWMSRSRSGLADRYVPETMYTQTKDYVYRVMSNYRMYQYLYDKDLKPL